MTIGEKLQLRRKELNLTQDEVAKKLHVSRQAVSNWELGKNYPDLETIILVSDVYQLSLDSLLKGDQLAVKEMKRTINRELLKKGGFLLAGLSLFICVIIDVAINRGLTWSLIVTASIASLMAIFLSYDLSNSHKLVKSFVCLSLLTLPFLFILEYSLRYAGFSEVAWFSKVGAPIALVWLGLSWIAIICQIKVKWHWAYSVALFCFLSVLGNQLTHLILNTQRGWLTNFITSGLGSIVGGLICIWLGAYLTNKKIK